MWLSRLDDFYITEALIYNPFASGVNLGDAFNIAIRVQVWTTAYIIISLTGIFAIKFSFLFFFRSLIDRVYKLKIYWRFIAIYTALTWAISCGVSVIACPYFDERAGW
jgi:hypothetical protein